MTNTLSHSMLASGFIDSIHECMPDTAPVRETLSFTRLVLEHPSPTGKMHFLHKALWDLIEMDPEVPPREAARQIRGLADEVLGVCNHSTSGQVLEVALHTLSLRFEDTPRMRMLVVDLGMTTAGLSLIGIEDHVPVWEPNEGPAGPMSPGPVRRWVKQHVARVCNLLLGRMDGSGLFGDWLPLDLEYALLALRMKYCVFRTAMDGSDSRPTEVLKDFNDRGEMIWFAVERALGQLPEEFAHSQSLRRMEWHRSARSAVRRDLEPGTGTSTSDKRDISSPAVSLRPAMDSIAPPPPDLPLLDGGPTLIVCRSPIVEATDRYDKEEVNRHKVLEHPLPLARMPRADNILEMRRDLAREFPWAKGVLDAVFDDLFGRAKLGIQTFGFPPTLLVGYPGSGKSRLAGRLADVFGIPRMDLSLGGSSDAKVLSGTARGWASGKPSDLVTFMATRKSASAMVLLDELDKSTDGYRTGTGLQSYLLGMLEPETARRQMDVFLKTECDLSGITWIATANTLSGIHGPLLSRLRVLMMRQPSAEHFHVIAEGVLVDTAKSWSLERAVLPALSELEMPWDRLRSAREVRIAAETALMRWARDLQRH
jgi:hypothetical protein